VVASKAGASLSFVEGSNPENSCNSSLYSGCDCLETTSGGEFVSRSFIVVAIIVALLGGGVIYFSVERNHAAERQRAAEFAECRRVGEMLAQRDVTSEIPVEPNVTFEKLLAEHGIESATAQQLIAAASPVFSFRRLMPGKDLTLASSIQGELRSVRYQVDSDHELFIKRDGDGFHAEIKDIPSQIKIVGVAGTINGSLFEGVMDAGETPELAMRLADIFRWDLDFYTDPRPGDTFRVVMEKREYANGQPATYGRILAAEYDNAGHPYQAVLFHDDQGHPAYYAADGKSLQKAFLRSPLKFAARISSHFTRSRFHPILKIYRPHLGTDYAAPTGTPVQVIANGRVVSAGWSGGGGNAVRVAHSSGYETYYMHLSRILVRRGQTVHQGQTIGLVGATGLATGPHLDFRLRQRGQFVNFERLKLPPALPVAKKDWKEFVADRDRWMAMLPAQSPGNAMANSQEGGAAAGK
jgi:murein DD-endopeptidase MepM/ murein hydrolase activator NlpD